MAASRRSKPWTADATAGATEIIIDHLDVTQPSLARAIGKPILLAWT
jgi:hypothetical protein